MYSSDNFFVRMMNNIFDLVVLNLLFIVCSIPLVTLLASTSSIFYAMMRKNNDKGSGVVRDFFAFYKSNIKATLVPNIILFVVSFAVYYNTGILRQLSSNMVADLFFVLFVSIIFTLFIYFSANMAAFENSNKQHFINSLLMSVAHPFVSIITNITFLFIVYVLSVDTKLFLTNMLVFSIIGFALVFRFYSFLFFKVFKKYPPYNDTY